MKSFRSELSFASFLAYSPRGTTDVAVQSRRHMLDVKENHVINTRLGSMTIAKYVAVRLKQAQPSWVSEYLGRSVALVPVPRSGLHKTGALWPAKEIADALHAEGFGARVAPCLVRASPVPKAARAAAKDRPKARDHFDSLKVVRPIDLPAEVTLIDDVVTRGAQLLGAAWSILAVRPRVTVRAFAVIRTMSDPAALLSIASPCEGTISLRGDDAFRDP